MVRRVPVAVAMRMALLGEDERLAAQRANEVGTATGSVAHDQLGHGRGSWPSVLL